MKQLFLITLVVSLTSSLAFASNSKPLAKVSSKAEDWRLQGYKYQEKGDFDNAILCYRKAIRENSNYATAYNDLGVVYEKKGMFAAAEASYLKSLKRNPLYRAAHSNLAYFYENKGDLSKAIYYWKRRMTLEEDPTSQWVKKAREKVGELQHRRTLRNEMSEKEKSLLKGPFYENKKRQKAHFKGWNVDVSPQRIEKEIAQRYFDQGVELYEKHQYDKALASFRMASNQDNKKTEDVKHYIVKINKIKQAIKKNDIRSGDVYKGVVSKEDLLLSQDHFKMGLDYFAKKDYERSFSSFTMAMTYNPYDEAIQKYVEKSKIKIQEQKTLKAKLREDALRSNAANMREHSAVVTEVKTKADIVNKGFVTTSQDMSVESFIRDGRSLFSQKRFDDAIYVWKQALLMDVSKMYTQKIQSLIDQALIQKNRVEQKKLSDLADVKEEEILLDVTRAAIPTKDEGSPSWTLRDRKTNPKNKMTDEASKKNLIWKKLNTSYSLNFKDASLKGVVDLLTDLTGLNIIIDTKEIASNDLNQNNITFKVSDMPLIKIIKAILRFTDFDYLIEDNLIWVTTKEKIRKEDISLVVYDVQDLIGKLFDFPAKNLGSVFSKAEKGAS